MISVPCAVYGLIPEISVSAAMSTHAATGAKGWISSVPPATTL